MEMVALAGCGKTQVEGDGGTLTPLTRTVDAHP